jgi:hypothetical protein
LLEFERLLLALYHSNNIAITFQFIDETKGDRVGEVDPIEVKSPGFKGTKIGINEWSKREESTWFHEQGALAFLRPQLLLDALQ